MTSERTGITWTQSAVLAGESAASAANMRDGNFTTGTATAASAAGWVQADLGSAQSVGAVGLAAGSTATFTTTAALLNGATLQYSLDALSWTTVLTVSGVTDTNGVNVFTFAPVSARYWRINKGSQLAVTEFRPYASAALNTSVRLELEAVRGGVTSLFKHDVAVGR
jgi:hypothetical protein